jgi:glycosyltransferase involved in cell wall biosynthesis
MISVIIPIYNEEDNLIPLYDQVKAVLVGLGRPWELILVDDGSTDRSRTIMNALADRDESVKIIFLRTNFGQTAALMAGLDFARGEIIISMDGDLQNDPRDIPNLLVKLDEGFDVVSGWRKFRKDHPVKRHLPSRMANWIISRISGIKLHDYGCSLKAYRKEVVKGIKLYGEMHRFIPIYASWFGARIAEIPVTHHVRLHGKSNYGLERTTKVVFDLMVVKFLSKYSQKPMYVFGMVGLVSLSFSFLSGLWALYLKFFEHTSFISTPLPLLVVMTGITGFMCILMGLLAELVIRTYYESQHKTVYLVGQTRNITQDPV